MRASCLPWGELSSCTPSRKGVAVSRKEIKGGIHCSAHTERHRYSLKELSFWLDCRVWGEVRVPSHVPMDPHVAMSQTYAPAPAETHGTVMSLEQAGRPPPHSVHRTGAHHSSSVLFSLVCGTLALVATEGAPLPRHISPTFKASCGVKHP